MTAVAVRCDGNPAEGWTCEVTLSEGGRTVSTHAVRVPSGDLARLAPASTPEDLVERSFAFLLEREPPSSILMRFDLGVISRYFPEYEAEIKRRVRLG